MGKTQRSPAFPKHHPNQVSVFNEQRDLRISRLSMIDFVKHVLEIERVKNKSVCLHFVSSRKISKLHERFFQDPTPTDCISFPDGNDEGLGEIVVCPKVAMQYATQHHIDVYDELALYVIHGILHLLGYDDLDPKKRKVMRKKEKTCMSKSDQHIKKLRHS